VTGAIDVAAIRGGGRAKCRRRFELPTDVEIIGISGGYLGERQGCLAGHRRPQAGPVMSKSRSKWAAAKGRDTSYSGQFAGRLCQMLESPAYKLMDAWRNIARNATGNNVVTFKPPTESGRVRSPFRRFSVA
jgi:hypothetical protein